MDIGELLQSHLDDWLLEREDILKQSAGLDSYIAIVNFIEFVKENEGLKSDILAGTPKEEDFPITCSVCADKFLVSEAHWFNSHNYEGRGCDFRHPKCPKCVNKPFDWHRRIDDNGY